MLLRNWIELGIVIAIFVTGAIVRYIIRKRVKRVAGFKGFNNNGAGRGWRMKSGE